MLQIPQDEMEITGIAEEPGGRSAGGGGGGALGDVAGVVVAQCAAPAGGAASALARAARRAAGADVPDHLRLNLLELVCFIIICSMFFQIIFYYNILNNAMFFLIRQNLDL